MFYYATAQRTHVYVQLLVCGLVLILWGFFFHPTPAPPLLYIHLSPIHQFTCLSNLRFIFSPAFILLHSHHFLLLLCADFSKIFYMTHTTLLRSLSKSSSRFSRHCIKSQRRTSSSAIFKPLHYFHGGPAEACGP